MSHPKHVCGSRIRCAAFLAALALSNGSASAIQIQIIPGSGFDNTSNQERIAWDYAVARWQSWISPQQTGTVQISVEWASLDSSTSGTTYLDHWYPVAGKALTGAQYKVFAGQNPAAVDARMYFNSNDLPDTWHFDPATKATNSQIDFVHVALHEIGHALGVRASYNYHHANSWGVRLNGYDYLTIWDTSLRDQYGHSPIPYDQGPDNFDEQSNVKFAGPNVLSNYGGTGMPVDTPGLSHVNANLTHGDVFFGLLYPDVAYTRGLYDSEVAMFKDVGWNIVDPAELHAKPDLAASSTSLLWRDGGSWDFGLPPTVSTAVFLDAVTQTPYVVQFRDAFTSEVQQNKSAKSITIKGPATLLLNGASLSVTNDIQNDGVITLDGSGTNSLSAYQLSVGNYFSGVTPKVDMQGGSLNCT